MTNGPLNLDELRASAESKLDKNAFDYYASGAHDEHTLRENRAAFSRIAMRYRVLVDVSRRDASTEVLGLPLSMPVIIAPTAFQKMAHPDGELATSRAAASAGIAMINSTLSNTPVEEVVKAGSAPILFQLYVYKDRGETKALIERAEAAGARALVLTVDAPLLGTRERDRRNHFRLPEGLKVANMTAAGMGDLPDVADSGLAAYVAQMLDPSLSFADLEWLKSITKLPLLVKGVVRGDDAIRCVQHGADGVVVSNHGGRQLDTSVATIRALPEVVDAVGDRTTVLVDGGVRRGTDVIKALALGAQAVLIGRPVLWGLAHAGQAGVERALAILAEEIDLAMALCGCPDVASITPDLIAP
ncbi:MAG: alpha-hydroxy-acid oxidizing protein [Sandaracinaceae bacterium]|nr:alpha-hydroxy-acid oxidizing protein [Sandaracinaceae bacterium]